MTLAIHQANDSNRRTPAHILDAAREVLGEIDLDPASDADAQALVQAKAHFILDEGLGGLEMAWYGRIWLNPPGGYIKLPGVKGRLSSASVWWNKLLTEYQSGRVIEALFLAFTLEAFRTCQKWGKPPQAFSFCVPKARLEFPSSDGSDDAKSPPAASAIIYLGPNVERFRAVFGEIGWCT